MITMKILLLTILSITLTLAEDVQEFSAINNQFTADVYKQVKSAEGGNFVISPLSLQVALAMTTLGARESTAKQLTSTLHLPENRQEIVKIFTEITPKLQATQEYTLLTANKIYVHKRYTIKDEYKTVVTNAFKSEIQDVNFDNTQEAANQINNWVEENTDHKIKNLFKPSDFNSESRLVLVNAMYFKGKWVKEFDKSKTVKRQFYLTRKSFVNVDMMEKTDSFNYYKSTDLKTRFLELPYTGNDVTLVIVLPDEKDGLSAVEDNINEVLSAPKFRLERVHVRLPRFKIETTTKFNSILEKLGMVKPFERDANFKDILVEDTEPLFISSVVQKGFIETDEKGTKAAVASGVSMSTYRAARVESNPYKFHVNHPFVYYLKHKTAGILFVGRYSKPEGEVISLSEPVADSSEKEPDFVPYRIKVRENE